MLPLRFEEMKEERVEDCISAVQGTILVRECKLRKCQKQNRLKPLVGQAETIRKGQMVAHTGCDRYS